MCYIPDPLEILEARMERLMDDYVDDYTCMGCGKRCDYALDASGPMGLGPLLCNECMEYTVVTREDNEK